MTLGTVVKDGRMAYENRSARGVANTINDYLATRSGESRATKISAGTLGRAVGVNITTWRKWIPPDGSSGSLAVESGVVAALAALHAGGVNGYGDRHLGRNDLERLAGEPDDAGRVALFVATMMWGSGTTNGRGPRYTARALTDERLIDTLRVTAEAVGRDDLRSAYASFRVSGVGESFFTKWFWAASLADHPARRPLICDLRVRATLERLGWTLTPTGRRHAVRYDAFVTFVHEVASHLDRGASAEQVEWLLFERSKDADCLYDLVPALRSRSA